MAWNFHPDDRLARVLAEQLDALHRVACRLERDPEAAADLVQETCLRAWRSREQIRLREPAPWLFRILRNLWVDRWRRAQSRPVLEELPEDLVAEAAAPAPLAPQDAAGRVRLEQCFDDEVLAALDELPEPERLALVLHTFGDLTYHEISVALECPLGTVMSRLHRARGRLRGRLTDYARRQGIVPTTPRPPAAQEDQAHAQA